MSLEGLAKRTADQNAIIWNHNITTDPDTFLQLEWLGLDCLPQRLDLSRIIKINCSGNLLNTLTLPNATWVHCCDNKLDALTLPLATYVNCSINALTQVYLPQAETVWCFSNHITNLVLPRAEYVNCNRNNLTILVLPEATHVDCVDNNLTLLVLPKATKVDCRGNRHLWIGIRDFVRWNLSWDRSGVRPWSINYTLYAIRIQRWYRRCQRRRIVRHVQPCVPLLHAAVDLISQYIW